jgi:hypothetical protein
MSLTAGDVLEKAAQGEPVLEVVEASVLACLFMAFASS